jgi:ABC-type polar amino acid transport system ATPase subunit
MIKEVLDVMLELARSDMTLVVISHEIGFAREVADRILFFDEGLLVEEGTPDRFFQEPREERTRRFLAQIL